jgi:hypothetical protein
MAMTVSNVTTQLRYDWHDKSVGQGRAAVPVSEVLAATREDLADAQDDIRYQAALSEGWPVSSSAPSVALRATHPQDGLKTISTALPLKSSMDGAHKRRWHVSSEKEGISINNMFERWMRASTDSLRLMTWLIIGFALIALVMSHDLSLGGG